MEAMVLYTPNIGDAGSLNSSLAKDRLRCIVGKVQRGKCSGGAIISQLWGALNNSRIAKFLSISS